jgi:hypothetical protein
MLLLWKEDPWSLVEISCQGGFLIHSLAFADGIDASLEGCLGTPHLFSLTSELDGCIETPLGMTKQVPRHGGFSYSTSASLPKSESLVFEQSIGLYHCWQEICMYETSSKP